MQGVERPRCGKLIFVDNKKNRGRSKARESDYNPGLKSAGAEGLDQQPADGFNLQKY